MKALVVNALGRGFDFQEVQIAEPIGREALVKVQASGLCHTDSLVATHDLVPLPAVLGHEVADIVAAVGPDVTQLRVGDHAVGSLAQACGACARCLSDRPVQRTHPEATLSQRSLSQGSAARLRRRNGRRNTANVRAGETVVLFGADGLASMLSVALGSLARRGSSSLTLKRSGSTKPNDSGQLTSSIPRKPSLWRPSALCFREGRIMSSIFVGQKSVALKRRGYMALKKGSLARAVVTWF